MAPATCPVCQGMTTVPNGYYGDQGSDATRPACRSCGGTGVVWPPSTEPLDTLGIDWGKLNYQEVPHTLNVTASFGDNNYRAYTVDPGTGFISEPIQPKVEHDDLVVSHIVEDNRYALYLRDVAGNDAAPPIVFHKGSPVDGWHGWTTQHALTGLILHMNHHQTTPFACEENAEILRHLHAALEASKLRAAKRKERGVLYDHTKP